MLRSRLDRLDTLTPGDFAAVSRQLRRTRGTTSTRDANCAATIMTGVAGTERV
jgi:hypothetical protein